MKRITWAINSVIFGISLLGIGGFPARAGRAHACPVQAVLGYRPSLFTFIVFVKHVSE